MKMQRQSEQMQPLEQKCVNFKFPWLYPFQQGFLWVSLAANVLAQIPLAPLTTAQGYCR